MEYLSDKSSVAKMDKNLEKISPFELKNRLIEMADESVKKMAHVMLNAGRGNPNWIATEAREAFFIWDLLPLQNLDVSWICLKE